jgi:sRNA-binding regulator protein Hfq
MLRKTAVDETVEKLEYLQLARESSAVAMRRAVSIVCLLALASPAGAQPANDNFANAFPIQAGQTVVSTNAGASKEPGEPNHPFADTTNFGGKSVWWKFTAPATAEMTLSTCETNFWTLAGVYTGSAVNALSGAAEKGGRLSCGSPTFPMRELLAFDAVAGQTYYIAIDALNTSGVAPEGTIVLQLHPTRLACSSPSPLGDLNGDLRKDIVFRRNDGLLSTFLMDGTQILSTAFVGTVGIEWTLVGIGDFNGDGRADLLFRRTDGTLSIYLMNGSQVLAAQVIGQIGSDWAVVGIGDFNRDGRADLLTRRTDGTLAIYLMNGFEVLASQTIGQIGTEWHVLGVGDFDGDGFADFLVQRGPDRLGQFGAVAVFLMNGFHIRSATTVWNLDLRWRVAAIADFNGDGKADLLVRNIAGTLGLFLMDGTNVPAGQLIGTVGTEWRMVAAGDLNGDGRADMVFRRTDGTLSVFLMNGFQILSSELIGQVGVEWDSCYGQPPSPAP